MDTRSKILGAEQVRRQLNGRAACWVSGHFDPLLAEHVRHLRECAAAGQLVVVEVTNSARPFLAQRARAELVAALSMVDYVVLSDKPPSEAQGPDAIATKTFIEHVLNRHQKETAG